jgi:iron-sulfur cluster assembly protein
MGPAHSTHEDPPERTTEDPPGRDGAVRDPKSPQTGIIGGLTNDVATSLLDITPRAAEKALALASRKGLEQSYLRLRVVAGGCSGFSYKLTFDRAPREGDTVLEAYGLSVLVDQRSAPILAGCTLEFSDAMLGGGFKVENPRATHTCACGQSFSV